MAEGEAHQEEMLNEQQRLREEANLRERMNQRIELVRQIADLERTQHQGVYRLKRLVNRVITVVNFSTIEEYYTNLLTVNADLVTRILDWEDLLGTDQEGSTVYPDRGQPEYRYSPDAEDFKNKTKTMELALV